MFFSDNLTSTTTRSDGSSHPKTLAVDNYETQTINYAIGLSVDGNDVDMQSQNSDLSSSWRYWILAKWRSWKNQYDFRFIRKWM